MSPQAPTWLLWLTALLPAVAGPVLWALGARLPPAGRRVPLGALAVGVLTVDLLLAWWTAQAAPSAVLPWGGPFTLRLEVTQAVGVVALLVPAVAIPIVSWASAHEASAGLDRLLGLLVAFVGAMQLLVLAADLLTLAIAWELVGGLSWALIAHRWREDEASTAAAYAFNATRLGGLGLWLAAGAALASTGELAFSSLDEVAAGPAGGLLAFGLLAASTSKAAQGPFAPWLFRAMEGPSSVSALLHSSTMVAAGAWVLIRLHEPLQRVTWLGPVVVGVGLFSALFGGVVAGLQTDIKRLLAASTSAQLGLVLVAVGAGSSGAALAHLVAHAAFKALLFLAAGIAIGLVGSHHLGEMKLGRRAPSVAAASGVGALALAAVPPLGAAFTKEKVVAAAGHLSPTLAVAVIGAGALSAWYALRFQTLAFGGGQRDVDVDEHRPALVAQASLWLLAGASLALGVFWLPGSRGVAEAALGEKLPQGGKSWELYASLLAVGLAALTSWLVHRRSTRLARAPAALSGDAADWLGLAALLRALAVVPVVLLARACAFFDQKAVEAGVRFAAFLGRALSRTLSVVIEADLEAAVHRVGRAALRSASLSRAFDDRRVDGAVCAVASVTARSGQLVRRLQSGAVPLYYALMVGGLLAAFVLLASWR